VEAHRQRQEDGIQGRGQPARWLRGDRTSAGASLLASDGCMQEQGEVDDSDEPPHQAPARAAVTVPVQWHILLAYTHRQVYCTPSDR